MFCFGKRVVRKFLNPGALCFLTGVGSDQMRHGLTDCSFVLKTLEREEKEKEGLNECEEKAETSQIP